MIMSLLLRRLDQKSIAPKLFLFNTHCRTGLTWVSVSIGLMDQWLILFMSRYVITLKCGIIFFIMAFKVGYSLHLFCPNQVNTQSLLPLFGQNLRTLLAMSSLYSISMSTISTPCLPSLNHLYNLCPDRISTTYVQTTPISTAHVQIRSNRCNHHTHFPI